MQEGTTRPRLSPSWIVTCEPAILANTGPHLRMFVKIFSNSPERRSRLWPGGAKIR